MHLDQEFIVIRGADELWVLGRKELEIKTGKKVVSSINAKKVLELKATGTKQKRK